MTQANLNNLDKLVEFSIRQIHSWSNALQKPLDTKLNQDSSYPHLISSGLEADQKKKKDLD